MSVVARQRPGKNVTAATIIQAIEELLDKSFSMRSVSYQRKAVDWFFPELVFYPAHKMGCNKL
jgi:hypothetical protein